jgi:hypothetical protein
MSSAPSQLVSDETFFVDFVALFVFDLPFVCAKAEAVGSETTTTRASFIRDRMDDFLLIDSRQFGSGRIRSRN